MPSQWLCSIFVFEGQSLRSMVSTERGGYRVRPGMKTTATAAAALSLCASSHVEATVWATNASVTGLTQVHRHSFSIQTTWWLSLQRRSLCFILIGSDCISIEQTVQGLPEKERMTHVCRAQSQADLKYGSLHRGNCEWAFIDFLSVTAMHMPMEVMEWISFNLISMCTSSNIIFIM